MDLCMRCDRPRSLFDGGNRDFCPHCLKQCVMLASGAYFLPPDLHHVFRDSARRFDEGGREAALNTLAAAITWAAQIGALRDAMEPPTATPLGNVHDLLAHTCKGGDDDG